MRLPVRLSGRRNDCVICDNPRDIRARLYRTGAMGARSSDGWRVCDRWNACGGGYFPSKQSVGDCLDLWGRGGCRWPMTATTPAARAAPGLFGGGDLDHCAGLMHGDAEAAFHAAPDLVQSQYRAPQFVQFSGFCGPMSPHGSRRFRLFPPDRCDAERLPCDKTRSPVQQNRSVTRFLRRSHHGDPCGRPSRVACRARPAPRRQVPTHRRVS